jgi:hypothetical protein
MLNRREAVAARLRGGDAISLRHAGQDGVAARFDVQLI